MRGPSPFVPSEEQMRICGAVMAGGNHAIFGEAGTGKTSLVRILVDELRGSGRTVVCVAPTGIAAQNLGIEGAMTIHRAFRLPDEMVEDAFANPTAPWLASLDVLVIDEISMVRSDVFSVMYGLLKRARGSQRPFGGVQVVVVGDFFQISPFSCNRELDNHIMGSYGSLYCFGTQAWSDAGFTVHKLVSGHRQAADPRFQHFLHGIHSNSMADCELARLNDKKIVNGLPDKGTPECQLTWLKEDALQINRRHLESIQGEPALFEAMIEGEFPPSEYPVDEHLQLKQGERVLLAANGYENSRLLYANGDFATFLGMRGDALLVRLERDGQEATVTKKTWYHNDYRKDGDQFRCACTGCFRQFPVLHGYAITINRSQGLTLSGSHINIRLPFDRRIPSGVVYTAFSRAQSLGQLSCNRMIEREDLQPPPEVGEFMERYHLG